MSFHINRKSFANNTKQNEKHKIAEKFVPMNNWNEFDGSTLPDTELDTHIFIYGFIHLWFKKNFQNSKICGKWQCTEAHAQP